MKVGLQLSSYQANAMVDWKCGEADNEREISITSFMRFILAGAAAFFLSGVIFLRFAPSREIVVSALLLPSSLPTKGAVRGSVSKALSNAPFIELPGMPEAEIARLPETAKPAESSRSEDEPVQPKLANPPAVVKGIYITSWVGGIPSWTGRILDKGKKYGVNAAIVDIKDYSGYVSYHTGVDDVAKAGAENQIRIQRPNALIKSIHDRGMYAIARLTVFQDSVLSGSHPEWALKNAKGGGLWRDNKGLHWMDPSSRDVWDYNIKIAKNALDRGFDEVNFDYIRFPSDGNLDGAVYPSWDGTTDKGDVMKKFFRYVRRGLPDAKISADIFGIAVVKKDDLGIGQIFENTLPYFDAVAPMVYPSHFSAGFFGYKNPAAHPYEVVAESMKEALKRRQAMPTSTRSLARLRPWIQVFDLGAVYGPLSVASQTRAVEDAVLKKDTAAYGGWLLWDPSNAYDKL